MIDYIQAGENGDHLLPQDEQDDHCAFDFCPCKPVMRPWMGRYFWVHQVSDERSLLEQAEAIRQVTSVQLWRDIEGTNIKHKIMPFPVNFQGAAWPKPADKHVT